MTWCIVQVIQQVGVVVEALHVVLQREAKLITANKLRRLFVEKYQF